jgi:hypothetical protein
MKFLVALKDFLLGLLLGLLPVGVLLSSVWASQAYSVKFHDSCINAGSVGILAVGVFLHFAIAIAIVSSGQSLASCFTVLISMVSMTLFCWFGGYIPIAVILTPITLMTIAAYGKARSS